MFTGLNNSGLYSDNGNEKSTYENARSGTGEQASDHYKRAGPDQEGPWAKIELGTNKLYKYRKYDVRLLVKKSWRLRSGVSEIDILKALLSARCLCEETRVGTENSKQA